MSRLEENESSNSGWEMHVYETDDKLRFIIILNCAGIQKDERGHELFTIFTCRGHFSNCPRRRDKRKVASKIIFQIKN